MFRRTSRIKWALICYQKYHYFIVHFYHMETRNFDLQANETLYICNKLTYFLVSTIWEKARFQHANKLSKNLKCKSSFTMFKRASVWFRLVNLILWTVVTRWPYLLYRTPLFWNIMSKYVVMYILRFFKEHEKVRQNTRLRLPL